jgi:predicted RNase H-like HicB family nuclease
MKYVVLIEKGAANFGAYLPDLPGCVAVGDTREAVEQRIREAIEFHLEGMLLDGEAVPQAETECCHVEVDLARVQAKVERERAERRP